MPLSDDMTVIVLLQVRVKPNSHQVMPNSTMYDVNNRHYRNDQIEWRISNPNDIIPYRILYKMVSKNKIDHFFIKKQPK